MVETDLATFFTGQDAIHTGKVRERAPYLLHQVIFTSAEINMRELVVANREGPTAEVVEDLTKWAGPDAQETRLA